MPTELPELPDDQYSLPLAELPVVGAMFDSTVLAGDARDTCGGGYLVLWDPAQASPFTRVRSDTR
jgi:hypothetical protein